MDPLAGLPLETADVLSAAAVIGERFEIDVLAQVVDRSALECLDLLAPATRAGIVEPDAGPHRYRFPAAPAHSAVFNRLAPSDQVRLHARIAQAIGTVHADQIDAHLFELAAHWSAAAVGDYRQPAASWIARAAGSAADQGLYESAATLYRRALEVGGSALDTAQRCRLLLGLASAAYRRADVDSALAACREAATLGARIGDARIQGAAALVVEPGLIPDVNVALRRLCESALAAGDDDTALRIRLTARLADVCHYLGDLGSAADACDELEASVKHCDDLHAVATALHALQLDASGPDRVDRRAELADRLRAVAADLDDGSEATWAQLWTIDIALQRGDLARAGEIVRAASADTAELADVIVRWHLLRAQAAVAQAQARFADAVAFADAAAALLAPTGNPLGPAIHAGQLVNVALHVGVDEKVAGLLGIDSVHGRPPLGAIEALAVAAVLLTLDRRREASSMYRSMGPVARWIVAPHGELFTYAYGIVVAVGLDERDDAAELARRLGRFRGEHIASGAGCVAYLGPAELWLGIAASYLGEHGAAVSDLEAAIDRCAANGATGFHVQAQLELARVLTKLARPGDVDRARLLAAGAAARAELLGMRPLVMTARSLLATTDAAAGGLSIREREVAELVGEGLTNRAIAQRLYLSERTVANHVQHVLDKLGLANRSQIAAWVAGNRMSNQ
jgi:DNA-binding NarL/FixJ family response regulator